MKHKVLAALMAGILSASFVFGGCDIITGGNTTSAVPTEGFAIYLTRDNIPPDKMEMLSHVAIAATPVFSSAEIVAYNWETHEIWLTPDTWEKIQAMPVPTSGISFVVCVNKAPLYRGAFWVGYSSQSFNGVTIIVSGLGLRDHMIQLGLGYPSESYYHGDDPRFNPIIREALEKAGKLK